MDWININGKEPDAFQEVIICSSMGKVKSAIYMGKGKWNTFADVVYWMPFPESPIKFVEDEAPVEPVVKKKRGRPKKNG